MHELLLRKLDWDDVIPDTLRPIWNSHFEMMTEIHNIKFNRAVIPENAVDLNVETLEFGDASKQIACVAVYARFKRQNGTFSCQLVFGRSKLIPSELSELSVGGHSMHGKVERKIKEIKKSISKNAGKERLSVLQWETICSIIGNTINDMPLALGNLVSSFETMDLFTPNRLKLGRNNERSPVGSVTISNNYDNILNTNKNIFNS